MFLQDIKLLLVTSVNHLGKSSSNSSQSGQLYMFLSNLSGNISCLSRPEPEIIDHCGLLCDFEKSSHVLRFLANFEPLFFDLLWKDFFHQCFSHSTHPSWSFQKIIRLLCAPRLFSCFSAEVREGPLPYTVVTASCTDTSFDVDCFLSYWLSSVTGHIPYNPGQKCTWGILSQPSHHSCWLECGHCYPSAQWQSFTRIWILPLGFYR